MRPDVLTRIPLFSALDAQEAAQLLGAATPVSVTAGEFLFRRGDYGDALYIVDAGLMDAVIDEGTPSERTLNTFFAGDYFGEMALLTQAPRSASLRALTDSRLVRISHAQFAQLLEEKPSAALHLSKVLSHYLSRTNAHLSRQGARISAIIPVGDRVQNDALAGRLLASLERQFGEPALIVMLGEPGLTAGTAEYEATDIGAIVEGIRALPAGGHELRLSERTLQSVDDATLVSVMHSLKGKYGHILVWMNPSEAAKRLPLLSRFDQTFLLASHPFEPGEWRSLSHELSKVAKSQLRAAYLAPLGLASPPSLPSPTKTPPIRLAGEHGTDRLARALAGKTVGLALGSGTAQGLAHLGVMKALIAAGIPIDLIAGTSGGALYGSMIASGLTIEASVSNVIHQTRRNLIDKLDFAFPARGLIRGNLIEKMVRSCIGEVTFANLAIPLYAVATDLDTGEEVVIDEGPVHQGVRASISVPGIFEPYALQGRLLIDGVVVNPLPVSVARAMGADIVIGVQVPAPGKVNMEAQQGRKRQKSEYSLISSIVRSHHFVGDRLADQSAADADVFIKPDVTRFGWREYRAAPDIIEAGLEAGQAAIPQISELLWGAARETSR